MSSSQFFRLDLSSEQLWREDQTIALRPETFAVLRYLVEHAGRLVTKDENLGYRVGRDGGEQHSAEELYSRIAHSSGQRCTDTSLRPTVHRRGYRFIAALTTTLPVVSRQQSVVRSSLSLSSPDLRSPSPSTQYPALTLVGRDSELTQLYHWLEKALWGER
jgi:DNA-binding winged helix-turn-helix (wHTH) protein